MLSRAIPLPADHLVELGLSTEEPPQGHSATTHFVGHTSAGKLLVLSELHFDAGPRYDRCHWLTDFDSSDGVTVRPATALTEQLKAMKLEPECILEMSPGTLGVGAAKNVINPENGIRCGAFLFAPDTLDGVRFIPNIGARFSFDKHLVSSLRHNSEGRHESRLDDAICRWEVFDPTATSPAECGRAELVVRDQHGPDVHFPGLHEDQSVPDLREQLSLGPCSVRTDYVAALPDDRILCSVWETALNSISTFLYVVLRPNGRVLHRINVPAGTRVRWSSKFEWFIAIGPTKSAIYSSEGTLIASAANPPRSGARYKRFRLAEIFSGTGLVFLSPREHQTNAIGVLPEPDVSDPHDYLLAIQEALVAHDKWLRKALKANSQKGALWTTV